MVGITRSKVISFCCCNILNLVLRAPGTGGSFAEELPPPGLSIAVHKKQNGYLGYLDG